MRVGIYLQIPFCQTKCTYCNFHTGLFSGGLDSSYIDAVCREISAHRRMFEQAGIAAIAEPAVDTVYFGGGTPSLFEPAGLARILAAVRSEFPCQLEEVTLEADPETITAEKAASWRAAGFNRVSMGVQSFADAELKAAGRMHRREDIFRATEFLRGAGFDNISFDLIAGLPHQSDASWRESLDQLLSLRPEHASIYLMEIDEGSRLGKEVLTAGSRYSAGALPDDDSMARYYEAACARLSSAGYTHYEISNWGLPGFESRHNLKYWRRQPYYGFGAGAHSFNGGQRWANAHDPAAYMESVGQGRSPAEQLEAVSIEQALEEELFLGLRQLEGIDLDGFAPARRADLEARLEELRAQGLVEWKGTRVRLAPDRLTVSNEVFVHLLNEKVS